MIQHDAWREAWASWWHCCRWSNIRRDRRDLGWAVVILALMVPFLAPFLVAMIWLAGLVGAGLVRHVPPCRRWYDS